MSSAWTSIKGRLADPALLAIAGTALLLRVVFILATHHVQPAADAVDYNRLAVGIAHGKGYGPSLFPQGGPSAFRPPGYPYVLGAVYAATNDSMTAGRLAGAVLGTIAVVLIATLATLVWGRRTGVVAGVIAAVYPAFIATGSVLLSEALFLPLFVGSLVCSVRYREARSVRWMVAAGLLTGLAVLARPLGALVILVMALFALRRPFERRALVALGAGVAAVVVVIVPWTIRNAVVTHRFVLLTDYSGADLAGTYNAQTQHAAVLPTAWRPPQYNPQFAAVMSDRGLSEVQLMGRLKSDAETYIRHHPVSVVRTAAYGTVRMADLTGTSWSQRSFEAIGYGRRVGLVAMAGWYVLALLAVGGLFLTERRRLPIGFWLVPVVFWLATVVVFADDRYRQPIEVFAVLLAAPMVVRLAERIRGSIGDVSR